MNRDVITLKIPSKPEYIPVARLTVSGIASNVGLDIECIEDLKVSIAEACINALKLSKDEEITIEFEVKREKICIRVENVKDSIGDNLKNFKELELGLFIIKSLMDEVNFNDFGIEMVKFAGVDN